MVHFNLSTSRHSLRCATKLQSCWKERNIGAFSPCCGSIEESFKKLRTSPEGMTCVFFLAKEKSRPGDSSQRPPKNGLNGEGGLGGLTVDGADCLFWPAEDGGVLQCSEGLLGKCSAWNDSIVYYTLQVAHEVFHSDFTGDHVWPQKISNQYQLPESFWFQSFPNQLTWMFVLEMPWF